MSNSIDFIFDLFQIGRNLIEFARASTPRIQKRIQSAKSHTHQNDNHTGSASTTNQRLSTSANNSPIHHLVYSSNPNSRRSTHHHHQRQSTTHHQSSASVHNSIQPGEQISCAHPDYHIGAFLDGEMMRPHKLVSV